MRLSLGAYCEPGELYDEYHQHLTTKLERVSIRKHKRVLGMLLSNLKSADTTYYSRAYEFLYDKNRYNKWGLSRQLVCGAIDWLLLKGYITHRVGIEGEGTLSSFKATDEFKLRLRGKRHYVEEYIVLKGKDKKLKMYTDSNYTNQARLVVSTYNKALDKFDIRLGDLRYSPQYYRIFNNDFDSGGRYYRADVLNLAGSDRRKLTIDNEPVVEVDYSSFFVSILEGQDGNNVDYDPYAFHSDRSFAKKVLGIIFNTNGRTSSLLAISDEIRRLGRVEEENASQLLSRALRHHYRLEKHIFNLDSLSVMHVEAEIATSIISVFTARGLPILVIHDGFVVKKTDELLLMECMLDSFLSACGHQDLECKVKVGSLGRQEREVVMTRGDSLIVSQEAVQFCPDYTDRGKRIYAGE